MSDITPIAWPQLLPPWVTAELALHDWQARIARVEAQEAAHFAGLPYVRGVAVIGSVGRGTQWPLSDIDLLIVADPVQGADPESFVRAEEEERNRRLHAAGIPNVVEAAGWVLTTSDVQAAVAADEEAFLRILEHPHWLGIVLRVGGPRVAHDPGGATAQLIARCQAAFEDERFLSLWQEMAQRAQRDGLEEAARHIARGDWPRASRAVIRSDGTAGCYARWRGLPQSLCRGVSRFLRAAQVAGEPELGALFLTANRLRGEEIAERFGSVPSEGHRERDVSLAVRRQMGEGVTELEAARDLLHVSTRIALRARAETWPAWTGVTGDEAAVRAQYEAAAELLRRLEAAR